MLFNKLRQIKCGCGKLNHNIKTVRFKKRGHGYRSVSVYTSMPPRPVDKGKKKHSWTSHSVRNTFIDFFCSRYDHLFIPSSSVIPYRDQGTYFTNAGMNQFSKIFQGNIDPESDMAHYKRVTNSQKCIRVGGKHNDLDDVGRDVYHHTYFEMLGNWSFGDYFKVEACKMALELLTEVYNIPQKHLYFTFFQGDHKQGLNPDTEIRDIWMQLGIPECRILPFGMKDNFWEMGDTGPCGPCTEIHYNNSGDPRAAQLVNAGTAEMMEIWNLVFMQYERKVDGTLQPLPRQHVDTGMGLERILAVLQGVTSNYDTDLFVPMFKQLQKISGCKPYEGITGASDVYGIDTAYRIVADHIRMITVCIADGLVPSKANLGFTLRKVMHRCIHQARLLGVPHGQIGSLVDIVTDSLGSAYPEIPKNKDKVKEVLMQTEDWYTQFLEEGKKTFLKFLDQRQNVDILKGQEIAGLLDGKYGPSVPLEVVEDLASLHGIDLDMEDYDQIIKSRNIPKGIDSPEDKTDILTAELTSCLHHQQIPSTEDVYKYDYTRNNRVYNFPIKGIEAGVVGLVHAGKLVESVSKGDKCGILLDRTCFYSESGGQVADIGELKGQSGSIIVTDVQRNHSYVLHIGTVEDGEVNTGTKLSLHFNEDHRLGCMRNHTATHLLNASLRSLLGPVQQLGSYVEPNKFSFTFSCHHPLSMAQLDRIQNDVLHVIQAGLPVSRSMMTAREALHKEHIVSLPNEIYPHNVYVISVNPKDGCSHNNSILSSSELCGGIHVHNTSDLESFCVIKMTGVGMGTKRLVCVTGLPAKQAYKNGEELEKMYNKLEAELKSATDHLYLQQKLTDIHQALQEELIPKQVHQNITDKLSKLKKIDVTALIQASSSSVFSLDFRNPKALESVLSTLTINRPLGIVSTAEQQTTAVLYFPEEHSKKTSDVLERICTNVRGVEWRKHSTNKKDFYLLIVKDTTFSNTLKSEIEKTFHELFSDDNS